METKTWRCRTCYGRGWTGTMDMPGPMEAPTTCTVCEGTGQAPSRADVLDRIARVPRFDIVRGVETPDEHGFYVRWSDILHILREIPIDGVEPPGEQWVRREERDLLSAQLEECRQALEDVCADVPAPDPAAGEAHVRADRLEAELKALRERVEACPRYDMPSCYGYSPNGCGPMEYAKNGDYFDVVEVLAALEAKP